MYGNFSTNKFRRISSSHRSALPRVSTLTEPLSVPNLDDYRYFGSRSIPSSLGDYGSSDSFSTYQPLTLLDAYNTYSESSMTIPASTPELSIEVLPSICSDRFANSSSYESFSEHNLKSFIYRSAFMETNCFRFSLFRLTILPHFRCLRSIS